MIFLYINQLFQYLNIKKAYSDTKGGLNNLTKKMKTSKGEFILRIYNNGNDTKRVEFEHLILNKLQDLSFSFKIPKPLKIKNEKIHFPLSNGTEAVVFEMIPGSLPTDALTFDLVHKIGLACGELNNKISQIKITQDELNLCTTLPYYDLWSVHNQIGNSENFYNAINSSLFDNSKDFPELRSEANYLVEEIQNLQLKLNDYLALSESDLPKQLIHGDLHHENILCLKGDKNDSLADNDYSSAYVTGILDFEFIAWDLRVMELAICLSKFASEKEPLKCFKYFIKGYAQSAGLNQIEINSLVDFIILRNVSNFVYFIGRYLGKEEPLDLCLKKTGIYAKRIKWLKINKDEIDRMTRKYFG